MLKIESDTGIRPRVLGIACIYLILGALGFFLTFCNLDGRLFWNDEAETALLARNIVKFGVPKVDDGLNHISLHGDKFDARDGLWTWSPWLPDYFAAASFAVFGETTWAGRAPFALVGWLTVAALGLAAWKIYRSHRVALAAMLLLGTSQVFLLHIRQCRYYSITVFGEVLLLYGIYRLLIKKRNGGRWILAGMALQFYCNYTAAAANIPMLLVLGWNLYRRQKCSLLPLATSLGILFLVTVPWLLYAEFWRQAGAEGHDPWTKSLRFYIVQFHFHFFPWCVVLLPFSGWLIKRFSQGSSAPAAPEPPAGVRSFERYLFLLPFLYTPVLLVMPGAYLRYLLPILPALCLLVSVWLFRYIRWTTAALALLAVQCVSNAFAVASDPFPKQYALRSPLADVVFSALLPYQDRFTDVLKFFQKHAQPGDVLVSWHSEFPLIFYTHLKVVDAGLSPFPLQPLPKWILPVSLSDVFFLPPVPLPDNLKPYYKTITLTVHDSPRVDNIPEPDFYQNLTAKGVSQFVIYERNMVPEVPAAVWIHSPGNGLKAGVPDAKP